jgi:hypothetical protein
MIEVKKLDGSIKVVIPRPENITIERFMVIAARLEKIMNQLGGEVRVR